MHSAKRAHHTGRRDWQRGRTEYGMNQRRGACSASRSPWHGREGESELKVTITIQDKGDGRRMGRRWMSEGRHEGRGRWMSEGRHEGRGRWMEEGRSADRPRVVGKLVELPDGRIRVVRLGESRGEGRRHEGRHGKCRRGEDHRHEHHAESHDKPSRREGRKGSKQERGRDRKRRD